MTDWVRFLSIIQRIVKVKVNSAIIIDIPGDISEVCQDTIDPGFILDYVTFWVNCLFPFQS